MLIAPFRSLALFGLGLTLSCSVCLLGSSAQAKSPDRDPTLEGEILLRLRSTSALQQILATYPLAPISQFGSRPIYRLAVTGPNSVEDTIDALVLELDVLAAEEHSITQSPETRRNAAWAIGSESEYVQQWAPQAVRLEAAHELSTGAAVRVAVLDTGTDGAHPALFGRLIPGWDFVDDDGDTSEVGSEEDPGFGHGTHVSGLVALVAPQAQIMPVRVLDAAGMGNLWVLAEALMYAVDPDNNPFTDDGVQVINLSLGTINRSDVLRTVVGLVTCAVVDAALEAPNPGLDPDIDITDPGYDEDRDRCSNSRGAVVIAAAGNDGSKKSRQYPAAAGVYGMLTVGASNSLHAVADFSNYGSWVDIVAPGEGITSLIPGAGYGVWSGTSMAAPFAAGTAALLIARDPNASPRDITRTLERSSAEICDRKLRQLDAAAALGDAAALVPECP